MLCGINSSIVNIASGFNHWNATYITICIPVVETTGMFIEHYFSVKYSAKGPSAKAGKNDKAAIIAITAKTIIPKIEVSVFKVPALSGIYFLLASNPAIANGPIIGMKRLKSNTIPVVIFQNGLLSPKPSKPEPLLAALEVYSYNISENP